MACAHTPASSGQHFIDQWRREHPGEEIPDAHVFTQPWPAGPKDKRCDKVISYTYKADRAGRMLRGVDEQVAKAAEAVAGLPGEGEPVHRPRRRGQERQTRTSSPTASTRPSTPLR